MDKKVFRPTELEVQSSTVEMTMQLHGTKPNSRKNHKNMSISNVLQSSRKQNNNVKITPWKLAAVSK